MGLGICITTCLVICLLIYQTSTNNQISTLTQIELINLPTYHQFINLLAH